MSTLSNWIAAIATAAAAIAAALSWRAARHSNRSAEALLSIESERRHGELTPTFHLWIIDLPLASYALARLELTGPLDLGKVDEMTIQVLDDGNARDVGPAVIKADARLVAHQVWGPWRLSPGTGPHRGGQTGPDLASEDGRTIAITSQLYVGDSIELQIENTNAPPWSGWTSEQWAQQTSHSPLRLAITCTRPDHEWRTVITPE